MHRGDLRAVLGLYRSGHDRSILEGALTCGVRSIDTSYNYLGFTSHRVLSDLVGDLLAEFAISTKVGFFPAAHGVQHCLDPARLHGAVRQAAHDLGRPPKVVFLHNPEHTLRRLPADEGADVLAAASTALADAAKEGLCGGWGIASWDPRALLPLAGPAQPRPDVLMTRAGLLVGAHVLGAIETLAAAYGLGRQERWGMSPFGGDSALEIWKTFNAGVFLDGDSRQVPNLCAAFRAAFELPPVAAVAVGAGSTEHLRALVDAAKLGVDQSTVDRYRALLNEHTFTARS